MLHSWFPTTYPFLTDRLLCRSRDEWATPGTAGGVSQGQGRDSGPAWEVPTARGLRAPTLRTARPRQGCFGEGSSPSRQCPCPSQMLLVRGDWKSKDPNPRTLPTLLTGPSVVLFSQGDFQVAFLARQLFWTHLITPGRLTFWWELTRY